MSDKETKERIEKESEVFVDTSDTCGDSPFEAGLYQGYIAGATSERPKAWNEAIDKAIELVTYSPSQSYTIEQLQKLKHKQP